RRGLGPAQSIYNVRTGGKRRLRRRVVDVAADGREMCREIVDSARRTADIYDVELSCGNIAGALRCAINKKPCVRVDHADRHYLDAKIRGSLIRCDRRR